MAVKRHVVDSGISQVVQKVVASIAREMRRQLFSRPAARRSGTTAEPLEPRFLFSQVFEGPVTGGLNQYTETNGPATDCPLPIITMNPNGTGGPAGTINPTASPTPLISGGSVTYYNGQPVVTATDLTSDGFGTPLSIGRTFDPIESSYATGLSANGNNWDDTFSPHIVQGISGTLIVVSNTNDTESFTPSGGGYVPANPIDQNQLTYNSGTDVYTLTDSTGGQTSFAGFTMWATLEEGEIQGYTDPGGNATTYTYAGPGNLTVPDGRLESISRSGACSTSETFDFLYASSSTSANLTGVQWFQNGNVTPTRQEVYDYYTGAAGQAGNSGDLESATIEDGSSNTLSLSFYTYYTSGEVTGGSPGYVGALQNVLSYDSYMRATAAGVNPALSSCATALAPYADNYFEYYTPNNDGGNANILGFVSLATAQGQGCTCSGSAGVGTYLYTYASNTNAGFASSDPTQWAMKTTEEFEDVVSSTVLYTNTIYSNSLGATILAATTDNNDPGDSSLDGDNWGTFYKYDADGRMLWMAEPSALALPGSLSTLDANNDVLDYCTTTSSYAYMNSNSGLIYGTDYYSVTSATSSTASGVKGYYEDSYVLRGDTGTPDIVEKVDYLCQPGSAGTIYYVADDTVYAGGGDDRVTSFCDTFQNSGTSDYPASIVTTLPVISAGQNGSGTANTITDDYDSFDRLSSETQGLAATDYYYSDNSDALTEIVQDPTGLGLTTYYTVDGLGRTTKEIDPNGNTTYTIYNDVAHQVRVYPGWNSSTHTTTGPIEISDTYFPVSSGEVLYSETLTSSAAPSYSGSAPTGTETIDASNIQSLSRSLTNNAGQVVEEDDYYSLGGVTYSQSAAQLGSASNNSAQGNYYATTYGYDGEGNEDRVQYPTGTITRTIYDSLGRVVSIWVGTDDSPTTGYWSPGNDSSPANMTEVTEDEYDNGGVGDSNLTQTTQIVGGSAPDRVTQYAYDWRDEQVSEKDGVQASEDSTTHRPIYYNVYDNIGEITEQDQYDGDTVQLSALGSTNGVPNAPSSSLLRAKTVTDYDDQGRVYQTDVYSVDQGETGGTAGTVGDALTTNMFYDDRGDLVATFTPGQPTLKEVYDNAGRVVSSYQTDGGVLDLGLATALGYSNATSITHDVVLSETDTTYDGDGNPILTTTKDRFDNDASSATGALGDVSTSPYARVSYVANYYDAADRLTASADYGTYGGSAFSPPGSAPSNSSTVEVTNYGYDADSVDVVTLQGAPTGGTFTLTFDGYTTGSIAYNASASTVMSDLAGLTSIGSGNVSVSGGQGAASGNIAPWTIRFIGSLAGANQNAITFTSSLTGGTSPTLGVEYLPGGDGGNQVTTTDPRGIVGLTDYDLLGQTVDTIAAFTNGVPTSDTDQTTSYAYDGDGDMLTATAVMPGGTNSQTTAYLYGIGSSGNLYSNDILGKTELPNTSTGAASSSSSNDQEYTYDDQGEKATYEDQNGTIHGYTYDVLGRETLDAVTTVGAGVSGGARSLGYSYDTGGRLYQATSYTNDNGTGVQNQVENLYNGMGELVTQYQENSGAVNTSTSAKLQYGYSDPSAGAVQTSETYVNGRTIDYGYGGQSAIASISAVTNDVTVTTATPTGLLVGSSVTISGVTPSAYDGTFTITAVSGLTFTYTALSSPGSFVSATDMMATGEPIIGISTITRSGTAATVTTTEALSLTAGQSVTIAGASDPLYDGTFTISTVLSSTSFKYTMTGTPANNASGVDLTVQSATPTLDGTIGRLTSQQDHAAVSGADSAGEVLEAYSYLGAGTIVQQTRPQTGVDLSLIQQNGDTLTSSDGGDRYTGLNRFDEVIDQNWVNPNTVTSTDRFQYSYDPDGNVLDKDNLVHAADSELYHASSTASGDNATAYDPLNRLTAFIRGTLSSSGNNGSSLDKIANASINTAAASDETWTLDALGNWTSSATGAGTGTGTAPTLTSTSRTNNSQNELTAVGSNNITYNNDGEMTQDANGNQYYYDAWGDSMTSVCVCHTSFFSETEYGYNALGQAIVEENEFVGGSCTTHDLYYSQQGQVTDDVYAGPSTCTCGAFYECVCGCSCCCVCYCCCTTSTIDDQQVYGNGYVDDLVLRDETTTTTTTYSDTTGFNYMTTAPSTTRLYVQQDAVYNVTALTSTSGTVDERFLYDPYGNQQVLTASWTSTTDAYNWLYGFQGGRTDVAVSGLVTFGARDYSASDGRWVAPDPIGYGDGMNVFQAMADATTDNVDPEGTSETGISLIDGTGTVQHLDDGGDTTIPGPDGTGSYPTKITVIKDPAIDAYGHRQSELIAVRAHLDPSVNQGAADCKDCEWDQVVRGVALDAQGSIVQGVREKINGIWRKLDGTRYADSTTNSAAYLSTPNAAGEADSRTNFIADAPNIGSRDMDQHVVQIISYFDDYLVCHGQVRYHVHWAATQDRKDGVFGKAVIDGIGGSHTDPLAADLTGDTWLEGNDDNGKPINIPNPVTADK